MNEVIEVDVPAMAEEILDIVELGDALAETKSAAFPQFALDNMAQWGWGG